MRRLDEAIAISHLPAKQDCMGEITQLCDETVKETPCSIENGAAFGSNRSAPSAKQTGGMSRSTLRGLFKLNACRFTRPYFGGWGPHRKTRGTTAGVLRDDTFRLYGSLQRAWLNSAQSFGPHCVWRDMFGKREITLLVRMRASSKFPQFRHRVASIPVQDSLSIRSQIVSITINPPHRSHDISFPPGVRRSNPCAEQQWP